MWELDYKESWAPKNWCFWTVVLEKTLESPLDSQEIKPVNPKGNQPWIFIGMTETEAPIIWPPNMKNQLIGRDHDCWEKLKAEWEGIDRGWDGWMASPTEWTWIWASSGTWWWTGKPGMLQSMASQKFGRDWVTELNWIFLDHDWPWVTEIIQSKTVAKQGLLYFQKYVTSVPKQEFCIKIK